MLLNHFYSITLLLITTSVTIINSKSTATSKSNSQQTKDNQTIKPKNPSIANDKPQNKTESNEKNNKTIPLDKESTQPETIQKNPQKPVNKTITVKNNITPDMLNYEHWSGTYEPFFTLTVDGKKIDQGNQEKIAVKDNRLEVRYDYSFANGFRKGAKIVSCSIEKNAKDVDITFSWDDKWHIKTKQAQPQKVEEKAFSG